MYVHRRTASMYSVPHRTYLLEDDLGWPVDNTINCMKTLTIELAHVDAVRIFGLGPRD